MPIRQSLNGVGSTPKRSASWASRLAPRCRRFVLPPASRARLSPLTSSSFGQAGERDADRLCDYALAKLREAHGRSSQFQSSSRPVSPRSSQLVRRSFDKGQLPLFGRGSARTCRSARARPARLRRAAPAPQRRGQTSGSRYITRVKDPGAPQAVPPRG